MRKTKTVSERFWSRVVKTEEGCWEWTGPKARGYGRIYVDGKQTGTHRLSWVLAHGPIPDGLWVCHHCDNPPCVNPAHLFLGTRTDNMQDCARKGRVSTIGKSQLEVCLRGHRFTDSNTYVRPNGHRMCLDCVNEKRDERNMKYRMRRMSTKSWMRYRPEVAAAIRARGGGK